MLLESHFVKGLGYVKKGQIESEQGGGTVKAIDSDLAMTQADALAVIASTISPPPIYMAQCDQRLLLGSAGRVQVPAAKGRTRCIAAVQSIKLSDRRGSIKVAQPKPALGQSGTSPFGAEPLLQTNCSRSASTDQRQLLLKPAVETCP